MASEVKTSSNGGIGFVGLLQIVFITLKLCGVVDWSWWWVMSPFLVGSALSVMLVVSVVLVALAAERKK